MLADFHNDYLTLTNKQEFLENYKKSNNIVIGAIFRGNKDYLYAKSILNYFLKNKGENQYFSFEDFSYEEDIFNLIYGLLDFKPIYVSLTWNGENNLAYGVGSSGKIKKRGIQIIRELNKRNIYLDVAHLSKESFFSALKYTQNVVCTHTCFNGVNQHIRNLDDDQIGEIVNLNGLIGLAFYTPFLTKNKVSTMFDIFLHIDYFCQKFGVDNLCLGTDLNGCNDLPQGVAGYNFSQELIFILEKHGYKDKDIEKILYSNLTNFLSRLAL